MQQINSCNRTCWLRIKSSTTAAQARALREWSWPACFVSSIGWNLLTAFIVMYLYTWQALVRVTGKVFTFKIGFSMFFVAKLLCWCLDLNNLCSCALLMREVRKFTKDAFRSLINLLMCIYLNKPKLAVQCLVFASGIVSDASLALRLACSWWTV